MNLTEKYDQLVYELQERQGQIAHVTRGSYQEAQDVINRAGVAIVEFEQRHGIVEARHLIEHEKGFAGQLEQFTAMIDKYSAPVDWTGEVTAGNIAVEDLEQRMAERVLVLAETKKSVATLKRMTADAEQRRKKLSREALEIAERRDPLSQYEREIFTQIFNNTKAERATNAALSEILQPV
jgi:hypothetical protein